MITFSQLQLSQRQIQVVAVVLAILLAPVVGYGSAVLVGSQAGHVSNQTLVQAPIAEQVALDKADRDLIANAIAIAMAH